MILFAAWLSGLVFGLGLLLSGMANPAKVLGFLDIAGRWDPSLAFVMMGAIAVGLVGFGLAGRRSLSLLDERLPVPPSRRLDARLILGSLTFGVGWGMAGFCPGPAVVCLGLWEVKAAVFVAAMIAGMALFEWLEARRRRDPASGDGTALAR